MSLGALAAIYTVAGLGCAGARLSRGGPGTITDVCALVLLWPLYGPFLLMRHDDELHAAGETQALTAAPEPREVAFLAALRRASRTPLGHLLPDESTARALAIRLRVAARKVAEIDELLTRPEMSEHDARSRLRELRDRAASEYAISAATMRLTNILRLRELRDRFATELDEVGELLGQLTTYAEVVRLAGATGDAGPDSSAVELVRELVARVEALDHVLADRMPDDDVLAGAARMVES